MNGNRKLTLGICRRLHLAVSAAMFMAGAAFADTNSFVLTLSQKGMLSWTNLDLALGYRVEWASSPTGSWSSSWTGLTYVPVTGAVYRVSVPMFYRVVATSSVPPVPLLIHADGPDGSTNILDEYGHAVTVHGDAQISTSAAKFGGSSVFFDGAGDYLTTPQSPDWVFGTNDFTVDFWVNFAADPGTVSILGPHTWGVRADWIIGYDQGLLKADLNAVEVVSQPVTFTSGLWYHLAMTRRLGTVRLFVDGNLAGQNYYPNSVTVGRPLAMGATENSVDLLYGYLDEIRIIKGWAAWTNNFTPPTAPYAP